MRPAATAITVGSTVKSLMISTPQLRKSTDEHAASTSITIYPRMAVARIASGSRRPA